MLLPKYVGPSVTLYRGQAGAQVVGPSWTHDPAIARKYALYGLEWGDLKRIPRRIRLEPRPGAVVLKATMRREIITGEIHCHIGKFKAQSGEFVVDPRGVKYETIEELKPQMMKEESKC